MRVTQLRERLQVPPPDQTSRLTNLCIPGSDAVRVKRGTGCGTTNGAQPPSTDFAPVDK
jgi:hypothetical protein